MDTSSVDRIPVIDLSQEDAAIVEELMTAFTTIGFATLINHGVPSTLRQQTFAASQSFFQLPLAQKLQYQYVDQSSNRGYIRCGSEHHDDYLQHGQAKQMDCKETMDIGWDAEDSYQNQWPNELPEASYKSVLLEYFETMDALQLRLMKYVAMGLDVDPDYLVQRCNGHHENLRLLHYPSTVASGGIRGNAHTDFGTLTLLVQDQVGGLKVQRTDGTWIDVEPTENSIIVNVGDMLMRWSNDRLKATLHKVEAPPNRDADGTVPERYSIAFFCNANKDVELKCLDTCCSEDMPAKYAPINAHNYITQRLLDTINTSAAKEQSEEEDPTMLSSSSTPNKLIQVVADDAENGTSITYTTVSSRMCRVCQQHQAKYTCPRCQLPYCSIDCYCNHNSSSNNNANDSSSSGVSSCTEEFYKSKVNAVLSLEQKEQDGQKMLNRHYQQQKLGGGTEGQEDMLEEEELYELWCKLEELGEDATQAQLDKLIPASLKRMFQQDLQQGAVQKLVLQSWYPWWRQQLVTVEEQEEGDNDTEEELVRSNSRRRSKTLDERLLELPPFESLSGGRPPSHLLVFNLIEVLYAICEVLILYHGSDNAIANEAVEAASTLISASAVLSKDARFSSLSEVLIHSTRGGKGDANAVTPWDTLVDDVASIVNSNRLVGRALLEALDVLTAARKEIKHWQEAKERQQHLEQLKKLGALRKKLEFFLSWSQDAEIKMMLKESSLKDEIQSWKVEVLAIQEEENRQNP